MHLSRMHMSMLVKGPAVKTSCSYTFYRLLPMIYNSNQQYTITEVQGLYEHSGGGGGGGEGDFSVGWKGN